MTRAGPRPVGAAGSAVVVALPGDFAPASVLSAVLRHTGRHRGTTRSVERVLRDAAAERARGTCPVAVDGLLHGLFAGVPEQFLRESAHEWYAEYRREHDPFPPGSRRLPPGTPVVIVSDAPAAGLAAVVAEARAAGRPDVHLLAGRPAVDAHGLLTGVNDDPVVGPARAERLQRLLADLAAAALRPADHGRADVA